MASIRTSHSTDLVVLRSPGEVAQMVPYLLGFEPAESLVLIGLRGGRVAVTIRMDIDAPRFGDGGRALQVLDGAGCDGVVLIVYADAPLSGALPWAAEVATAATVLEQVVIVHGALLVARGRWWSYTDEGPADGQDLPGDSSIAAAAATYAGMSRFPDRDQMLALLDPAPDEVRSRAALSIKGWQARAIRAAGRAEPDRFERAAKRAIFAAARRADDGLFSITTGPGDRVGQLGLGLAMPAVRDSLWVAVDHRRLDGRALWRELHAALPDPYDLAPLFLFAWASWRDGNGVLAGAAAERVAARDPQDRAALLLLELVAGGVDPFRTPRMRRR